MLWQLGWHHEIALIVGLAILSVVWAWLIAEPRRASYSWAFGLVWAYECLLAVLHLRFLDLPFLSHNLWRGPDSEVVLLVRMGVLAFAMAWVMTRFTYAPWFRVGVCIALGSAFGMVWGTTQFAIECRVYAGLYGATINGIPFVILERREIVWDSVMMGIYGTTCGVFFWLGSWLRRSVSLRPRRKLKGERTAMVSAVLLLLALPISVVIRAEGQLPYLGVALSDAVTVGVFVGTAVAAVLLPRRDRRWWPYVVCCILAAILLGLALGSGD